MEIQEVSDKIDRNLEKLEKELVALKQRLPPCDSAKGDSAKDSSVVARDIDALEAIKAKLIKSRELAWRAHNLKEDTEPPSVSYRSWLLLIPLLLVLIYLFDAL